MAADGRSAKTSSKTTKPSSPNVTPGAGEPRERKNTKKVMTSTTTVLVEAVEVRTRVGDVVTALATAAAEVIRALEVGETMATLALVLTVATAAAVEAVVVLFCRVMTQDVATPLPLSWQTTGWKGIALGGQVSCVKDMRYRFARKVKRLVPTQASGVVCPAKIVSNPLRNGGATETISWQ